MALSICAGCSRHVRSTDSSCPFCGVAREVAEVPRHVAHPSARSRASLVFGHVAAAAAVASAVACAPAEPPASPSAGPTPTAVAPIDTSPAAMYGAPPALDAGAGPAPEPPAPPAPPRANGSGPGADDPPSMVAMYGAAPALQDPDAPKPKPKPAPKAPKK